MKHQRLYTLFSDKCLKKISYIFKHCYITLQIGQLKFYIRVNPPHEVSLVVTVDSVMVFIESVYRYTSNSCAKHHAFKMGADKVMLGCDQGRIKSKSYTYIHHSPYFTTNFNSLAKELSALARQTQD